MNAVLVEQVLGRSLVPDHLFRRLVTRLVVDEQITRPLAERILDQALAFIATCGHNHRVPLSPSKQVDIGWHTFILYTREYADFCHRVAGRFVHHAPTDDKSPDNSVTRSSLHDTIAAMAAAGFHVDAELWDVTASAGKCNGGGGSGGKCHQCHAGCTESP